MHRYIELCVPTLERYREIVQAKENVDAAQMEMPRVWARVSKITVNWVEDLKKTVDEVL